MTVLLCTVRGCALPLEMGGDRAACARGHSFDRARSGYWNLLQPQDKKSKTPGDSADAVAARRRFLDRGHGEVLLQKMIAIAANATGPLLDVGCGEGYHTDGFRRALGVEADGIDLSVPAIDLAAKRYRDCRFVVGNADRFLPYADASFGLVTSITARMTPGEFRRVLRDDGMLLVAVPAPNDVIELRAAVLGSGDERDRTERAIATFAEHFTLARHERIEHRVLLDRDSIHDVMASSYRGLRASEREKLAALESTQVTLSRDVLSFAPR
jgi:23S rRNA (guanine745-N1)-methyltransferase